MVAGPQARCALGLAEPSCARAWTWLGPLAACRPLPAAPCTSTPAPHFPARPPRGNPYDRLLCCCYSLTRARSACSCFLYVLAPSAARASCRIVVVGCDRCAACQQSCCRCSPLPLRACACRTAHAYNRPQGVSASHHMRRAGRPPAAPLPAAGPREARLGGAERGLTGASTRCVRVAAGPREARLGGAERGPR